MSDVTIHLVLKKYIDGVELHRVIVEGTPEQKDAYEAELTATTDRSEVEELALEELRSRS